MALSRSGTCWIGRNTVEGKYLLTGSLSPIVVYSNKNTANASITELSASALNGNAFASFKPKNSGADAAALATAAIADAATACKGDLQGVGTITTTTNVVLSSEYYSSWRSVINSVTGAAG